MNNHKKGKQEKKKLKKTVLVECINGSQINEIIQLIKMNQKMRSKEVEDYFIGKKKTSRSTVYRILERCCEEGILEKSYYGKNKYLQVTKQAKKMFEKVSRFLELEQKYFPEIVIEEPTKNEFVLDKALSEEL